MRIAQVTGSSGAGVVAEIHESASVQALQEFLTARGIQGRAIAAPSSWVVVGTAYDGANFVVPEIEPEPQREPATIEAITSELDLLRQQVIARYVAQWGEVSRIELWPLLDAEMVRAAGETDLNPEAYPAIAGFLIASGFEAPTAEQIAGAAASLRANKIEHVKFLRRGELLRQQAISEYDALTDEEKLSWDAAERWAELEAE